MKTISEKDLFPYRPIPFYYITSHNPTELTYDAFYTDLSDMKAKGYGGIVLFNRPPEGFSQELYFTPSWFSMVGNCLRACRDLNLRVWINDDYDAPPGTIGGKLQRISPHLQPQRLRLQEDGSVNIENVPWGFPAFEDPESAKLFQQYVYEEYRRRFGEYFRTTIIGFFSDADSRRVNSCVYSPNSDMKDYFPWSKNFSQSFEARYNYDIQPYLSSILRREASPQSRDYWEHCGELYMGWFQSNYEWCQKNGLEYTFHTSDSAPFRIETTYFNSTFHEGKAIDAGIHCDWPGVDHELLDLNGGRLFLRDRYHMSAAIWGGDDSLRRAENFYDVYADLRAKQAQSCAYLHNKKGVMCEMYAAVNWNASYKDLRNIASWQIMQGVNFIVYQAYHYKLRGNTKFFAPLSFGRHSHTDFDMKAYNDLLAEYAYRCSQGKLKVDFALLDPTDAIWEGTGDSWIYLDLAKKLNHFPHGYILSDIKGLKLKSKELKAVINPGLQLSDAQRSEIHELGLDIIEADEITTPLELEQRYPTGLLWEGNGNIMFMRRELENGKTVVIIGNIEQEETLIGTLWINGYTYSVELTSGELAFFGDVSDTLFREPSHDTPNQYLQQCVPVTYEKPNIIPLMRWEDLDGHGFSLIRPQSRVSFIISSHWIPPHFNAINNPPSQTPLFPFTVADPCNDVELLISDRFLSHHVDAVYLDGIALNISSKTMIFDDPYTIYRFDIQKGTHTIGLHIISDVHITDEIFLRGDFGADIHIDGDTVYYGAVYSMQHYLPEHAQVILSKRPNELSTNISWAEQQNPFYSGYVDYHFSVCIDETFDPHYLVMPNVRDAVKVYIDDIYIGGAIVPPYRIPITLSPGVHQITIRTANTLGNMLEGYKAPSGLCEIPYII